MIPFTIRANSLEPEQIVLVYVTDDEMFEPVEEGFRLVLIVDETMTPRSHVSFVADGQLALLRIDDYTDSELHMAWISTSNQILKMQNLFELLQGLDLDFKILSNTLMTSQEFTLLGFHWFGAVIAPLKYQSILLLQLVVKLLLKLEKVFITSIYITVYNCLCYVHIYVCFHLCVCVCVYIQLVNSIVFFLKPNAFSSLFE